MKISGDAFMELPGKAVTLIGMSGVGKSHTAKKLAEWGWQNYSCDYLIGTEYLQDEMKETLSLEDTLGGNNMQFLSSFVGKLGSPDRGGLLLGEFRRRQKLYYQAEAASLRDLQNVIEGVSDNVVCDSTGSLCEIEDPALIEEVGKRTVFVYLKAPEDQHGNILERAFENPKPLFFPPDFFDEQLGMYLSEKGLADVAEIDPDDFLRWIFPHLFAARLPKYERLARQYGVVIPAHAVSNVESADAFAEMVAKALDEQAA